ncbi:hypothetical protein IX56_07300 [Paracoccus sanguinis]|uniref:Uncharacterized protein n=1 Tax=Paracoccus sanguinis TaxID=1545044 RepID=A0A099GIC6_9RHOB|nr:hypothetical protein IX56_07300 [Paracoccus sanguinis]
MQLFDQEPFREACCFLLIDCDSSIIREHSRFDRSILVFCHRKSAVTGMDDLVDIGRHRNRLRKNIQIVWGNRDAIIVRLPLQTCRNLINA